MLTVEEIAEFKEAYVKYKSGFNQRKRKGQPKLPKKDEVPDWTDPLLKQYTETVDKGLLLQYVDGRIDDMLKFRQ